MYTVNTLFMAFAKGQESKEFTVKRYLGVAPVTILGVNLKKAELEKIYGTSVDKEPEYVGETTVNGEKVPQARIEFIVKTNPEKTGGIDMISKVSFFVSKTPWVSTDGVKVQVVNKYGETFWISHQDLENKTAPAGMSFSMEGVRKTYKGEAELTEFLKNFLVIPGPSYLNRVTGKWEPIKNLEDAEAQLGHVADYFKGDVSEIRDIISSQPENEVKLCFGIKTTEDNKQYQDVYLRKTLRLRVTDYSKLDEDIQRTKAGGGYANTEFSVEPLHEYVVTPTTFATTTTEAPKEEKSWYN